MAGELKLNISTSLTKGNFKDQFQPGQISVDQATQRAYCGILSIGTTEEAVTFTDVTTLGWLVMRNLDATNYVTYGPESAGAMVTLGRMKAGEPAVFRLNPGVTLRLQANTAACNVEFRCYND